MTRVSITGNLAATEEYSTMNEQAKRYADNDANDNYWGIK